jgi:hypothetical protein
MNFREKLNYLRSLGWSIEQRQDPEGVVHWCYVEYDDDEDIHGSSVCIGGNTYEEAVERAYASRMRDEQADGIRAGISIIMHSANEEYGNVVLQ